MNHSISLRVVLCCGLLAATAYADHHGELQTVKAGPLELKVPKSWKSERPRSRMRAAQLSVPGKDGEKAELVVFDFGGPSGGLRNNVERWLGQFQSTDRKVEMLEGKHAGGSYFWVALEGTWKKPIGPPIAQRTTDTPDSAVTNVMLVDEKNGSKKYYFLKLMGPNELVKSQSKALKAAFGADAETEKPFSLD